MKKFLNDFKFLNANSVFIAPNIQQKYFNVSCLSIGISIAIFELFRSNQYPESILNNFLMLIVGCLFILLPFVGIRNHKVQKHSFSILLISILVLRSFEVNLVTIPLKSMIAPIVFSIYLFNGIASAFSFVICIFMLLIGQQFWQVPDLNISFNYTEQFIIYLFHIGITATGLYAVNKQLNQNIKYLEKQKERTTLQDHTQELLNNLDSQIEDAVKIMDSIDQDNFLDEEDQRQLDKLRTSIHRIKYKSFKLSYLPKGEIKEVDYIGSKKIYDL